jgi:hypothetical protein
MPDRHADIMLVAGAKSLAAGQEMPVVPAPASARIAVAVAPAAVDALDGVALTLEPAS